MSGTLIGMGGSCYVTSTDNRTVLKGHQIWEGGSLRARMEFPCEEDLQRESYIYAHLGRHRNILKCYGLEEVADGVHSLRLELAPHRDLRQYIQGSAGNPPPVRTRLNMCLDFATGLAYIHAKGVWHSDITCRNLFLFADFRVKIGDFGGSLIEGQSDWAPSVCEEPDYELPGRGREFQDRPRIARELFALGTGMYEIMAWRRLFPRVRDDRIVELLAEEQFPSTSGLVIGGAIEKCWNEQYESARQVVRDIKAKL